MVGIGCNGKAVIPIIAAIPMARSITIEMAMKIGVERLDRKSIKNGLPGAIWVAIDVAVEVAIEAALKAAILMAAEIAISMAIETDAPTSGQKNEKTELPGPIEAAISMGHLDGYGDGY